MAQFLSPEWLEAVKAEIAKEAPVLEKEFKGVTTSLKNVAKNVPGGGTRVMIFRINDGKVQSVTMGTDADVGKETSEFTMTGEYPIFVAMNRGELDSKTAIMQRKLRLDGNVLKALRLNRAFDTFNNLVRKVPAEY